MKSRYPSLDENAPSMYLGLVKCGNLSFDVASWSKSAQDLVFQAKLRIVLRVSRMCKFRSPAPRRSPRGDLMLVEELGWIRGQEELSNQGKIIQPKFCKMWLSAHI